MVVDGKINYTVADYTLASVNKFYYPILDISVPISLSQRIAWAVRKNSPKLLRAVNQWIKASKRKDFYYVIYDKYFKNRKGYRRRVGSPLFSKNEGKISPYDKIIRKNAQKLGWDWRLLASLIYQESRFDPYIKSWAGASGLMQIMPETAKELGIRNINNPKKIFEPAQIIYKNFTIVLGWLKTAFNALNLQWLLTIAVLAMCAMPSAWLNCLVKIRAAGMGMWQKHFLN